MAGDEQMGKFRGEKVTAKESVCGGCNENTAKCVFLINVQLNIFSVLCTWKDKLLCHVTHLSIKILRNEGETGDTSQWLEPLL